MSKRCELTGISPLKGHNVSHAKNKTKQVFTKLKKVSFRSDILKKYQIKCCKCSFKDRRF